MGRYDLILEKEKEKRILVTPPDSIGEEIKNDREKSIDLEGFSYSAQTTLRGKTIVIRGPGGFQVNIPLRHVSIHQEKLETGLFELHLSIPASVARSLSMDIASVREDPTEMSRVR